MKKNYKTFLLSFVLVSSLTSYANAAIVEDIPYYSDLGNVTINDIDKKWTIVDNNNNGAGDAKTWVFDSANDNTTSVTGAASGIRYQYHSTNQADDWAISPGFKLAANVEYHVTYWYKESKANNETLNVFFSDSYSVSEIQKTEPICTYNKTIGTTWKQEDKIIKVEKEGTYYVSFQCASDANKYNLYVRGFSIKENKTYPSAPTNLQVSPAQNKELEAVLSWVLPTTDDKGNVLASTLTAVKIKRDGEVIATIGGDATSFTDNATYGLTPGMHTYEVSVLINDTESLRTFVTSSWIGPKAVQELPYLENFKTKSIISALWSFIDVDGDGKANTNTNLPDLYRWSHFVNAMGTDGYISIYSNASAKSAENDWAVSAPLKFTGKGEYKLSFMASQPSGNNKGCSLELYLANDETVDALSNGTKIGTITKITKTSTTPASGGQQFEFSFNAPSAGTYYIGILSNAPKATANRQVSIDDFKVELVSLDEAEPVMVTLPYDSKTDDNWAACTDVKFNLVPGYYEIQYATEGDVTFTADTATADTEFKESTTIIKATNEELGQLSSTADFTSLMITPVDYTPADYTEAKVTAYSDHTVISWTNPSVTALGSPLYEILSTKVYCDNELIGECDTCMPGTTSEYSYTVDLKDSNESKYYLSFANLSGESTPKAIDEVISSVESINIDEFNGNVRIFNISGTEFKCNNIESLDRGIYIISAKNKTIKLIKK